MDKVNNRELLFNITNCLEDVRIEAIMERLYPGFLTMFRRMVPYIQERKEPLIQIDELRKKLKADGKSDAEIDKAVKKKNEEEIIAMREMLTDQYTKTLVDQLIESEKKRRENAIITELQKIMDLLYLKLRNYDADFYPQDVRDFVDEYLMDVAKEVINCKTTADVLKVSEIIYEILTNEKGTQVNEDKKRREMIQKMKGKGGKGKSGQGQSGEGEGMTEEEIEEEKEKARERERKAREERQKKREQGADVEDFVKNKKGEDGEPEGEEGEGEEGKGKGEKGEEGEGEEGEGKKGDTKGKEGESGSGGEGEGEKKAKKFRVGQRVKSLDHEGEGTISKVARENGELVVEIDWDDEK